MHLSYIPPHPSLFTSLLTLVGVIILSFNGTDAASAAANSYYVDCTAGSDNNSGTSPSEAWRSMERSNDAALQPGDSLQFKRGCTWNSRLDADWTGTASQPVTISAYGEGALPIIQNGLNQNVKITGSYQVIEHLHVRYDPLQVDAQCNNQAIGYYIGFNFLSGAKYNTLRYSEASGHTAGVRIAAGSTHNRILSNRITENNVMERWQRGDARDDLGAWGVLINGNDNEIAHNFIADNNARCSYGAFRHGNSVEIFEGQRNNIHHNSAWNDRVFSELGGTSRSRADGNTFAFNLHVSAEPQARFLVVRGAGNVWGPTWRTLALNNTVYLTHETGQGVSCGTGCNTEILTLRNNILWAEEKVLYTDGPIMESNNIYWRADGNPFVQAAGMAVSSTSRLINPGFVAAGQGNLQLRAESPAVDRGAAAPLNRGYVTDIVNTPLPQGAAVDVGAYEVRDRSSYNHAIFVPLIRR